MVLISVLHRCKLLLSVRWSILQAAQCYDYVQVQYGTSYSRTGFGCLHVENIQMLCDHNVTCNV